MKTNQYIKELENGLSMIESEKRKVIIEEIKSYISESDVDYSMLVERFGTPEDLAKNYLEDMPIPELKRNDLWKNTKKVLLTLFIFLVVVFIGISVFIYNKTKDPFDYSKFDANSIDTKVGNYWKTLDPVNSIDISQSKVTIYWSDLNEIKISCTEKKEYIKNNTLYLKQDECYLKVPKQEFDMKIYQSKIVVVEPSEKIKFDAEQSRISISAKKQAYNYIFNGKQSDIKNFSSDENGILIEGNFIQSQITPYEY